MNGDRSERKSIFDSLIFRLGATFLLGALFAIIVNYSANAQPVSNHYQFDRLACYCDATSIVSI